MLVFVQEVYPATERTLVNLCNLYNMCILVFIFRVWNRVVFLTYLNRTPGYLERNLVPEELYYKNEPHRSTVSLTY